MKGMKRHALPDSTGSALQKLCGADIELGNSFVGTEQFGSTSYQASRALLAEIHGVPSHQNSCSYGYCGNGYDGSSRSACSPGKTRKNYRAKAYNSSATYWNLQDMDRRFLLANGGSAYIDLGHLELAMPEVLSAFDHVAAWHGMLRIAREALHNANEHQPAGRRIQVLVNNSDGQGNSWGSHLNFLIRRETFENIFSRRLHYLQYLASFQVSSLIVTGQGKVGAENPRSPCPRYQLSARADFFETMVSPATTYHRPIINSRDEPLCGSYRMDDPEAPARLHVIFFDSALAHGSALLRVGLMQLILTLIELGHVNPRLILEDPLDAVLRYSYDPTLRARAAMATGERLTALELQSEYLEEVKRHAARGVFEGVVPRAKEIIAYWEDTLNKLGRSDWKTTVAPRVDWIMKLMAIERAMEQRPELDWNSPEIKVIDCLYSGLDDDGLYWAFEASGFAEQLVPQKRIAFFTQNPPPDTRAWTRAMLLRRADLDSVVSVDWDAMTFKLRGGGHWPIWRTVHLRDPLRGTQAEAQPIFDQAADFNDLLDALQTHSVAGPGLPATKPANENGKGEERYAIEENPCGTRALN